MSMVFLVPHSTSTSLQVLLLYSSFSDTYHILPHIILCPLLLLATNNSSSPTLLSSTFLYVLLLVHHGVARLSPLLNVSSFSTYTFPFFNTNFPSIYHSFPLNTFTPAFFISSTTLATSLFLLLVIFIFLVYLLQILLLLLLIKYESNDS